MLLVIAIIASVAIAAKVVVETRRRSAARHRLAGGQRALVDHAVVTLKGTVRLVGEPLHAPLSGRACVFHRSTAKIYGDVFGRTTVQYATLEREHVASEVVHFVLATPDGDVVVEGDRADTAVRASPIIPRSLDRERDFLIAAGIEVSKLRHAGFDEVVVEPGARIAVNGILRIAIVPATQDDYRDARPTYRLVGDDTHPLTIGRG